MSRKVRKDVRGKGLTSEQRTRNSICHAVNIGADYSDEELEFIKAVDVYKSSKGVKFPTLTELFHIIKSLGYTKGDSESAKANLPPEDHQDQGHGLPEREVGTGRAE